MGDPSSNRSGVSHLSAFVLTMITLVCVLMIGATGIVKYQLDRSELALSSPDITFTAGQEIYDRTLRSLGYGGFLEAAYRLIAKHDGSALGDMKLHLKTAQEALSQLNDTAPTGPRRDLQGLLELYASLYAKAEQSQNGNAATPFTLADLAPAFAALPALDTRLQAALAANRIKAQDAYRFWGLSLTLIAWCSLLLAAAMASGVYLIYRNRQAQPLRALSQSVLNLAQGDMQHPVWGTHRNDAIGDLARAVDQARLHFAHLPDLAIDTDQGPMRIKFEGETRSLFEAMMRNMVDEFEKTRRESSGYTHNLGNLQNALSDLAGHLNVVIDQLQTHDTDSHQALQRLVHRINDTSQSFTAAQERTIAHMNKLVPFMQDRASSMAEVTHIAGTQVSQSLQKLMKTEEDLRAGAAQSQQVVEQFAANTNQLSERLFASANLMQASSKMLSETTDTVQSRFNEAVETFGRGETHLKDILAQVETRLSNTARAEEQMSAFATRAQENLGRMESAVGNIAERHDQLSEQAIMATHRMESVVASFETAQRTMTDAMQRVRLDGEMLTGLLQELRKNNEHLLEGLSQNSKAGYVTIQSMAERSQRVLQALETRMAEQSRAMETSLGDLASHTQALNQQVQSATTTLTQATSAMRNEQERLTVARETFSANVDRLGSQLETQTSSTLNRTEHLASQNFSKLSSLTDEMEDLMRRLDLLSQLTGTLGNVAGQLGQIVPALANGAKGSTAAPDGTALESIAQDLSEQLHGQWNEAMAHIEGMHDQLARMIEQQKDQLETRLVVMDKKLRAAAERNEQPDPQQMSLMNEIIITLAKISEHIMMLDDAIQTQRERQA